MGVHTVADIVWKHARWSDRIDGDQLRGPHDRLQRVAPAVESRGPGLAGGRGQSAGLVAFLDKNGPEYFEVLFGTAKLNAVLCAVNWRLAPVGPRT